MVKSIVGNLEVMRSEMVHLSIGYGLTISLNDLLFLVFVFKVDDSQKTHIVTSPNNEKNKLVIECFNFTNSLGEGFLSPVPIGKFQGKQLYLTFYVWTADADQGKRIVNYCLYQSNE